MYININKLSPMQFSGSVHIKRLRWQTSKVNKILIMANFLS